MLLEWKSTMKKNCTEHLRQPKKTMVEREMIGIICHFLDKFLIMHRMKINMALISAEPTFKALRTVDFRLKKSVIMEILRHGMLFSNVSEFFMSAKKNRFYSN